jgi:hypothetical protein
MLFRVPQPLVNIDPEINGTSPVLHLKAGEMAIFDDRKSPSAILARMVQIAQTFSN